jgi:hypothetical protein
MAVVITPSDRLAFKRCRRAWDFGSRLRQGWEPAGEPATADLGAAVRAALAVWYFPGMWEWGRAIVRPLAFEAYRRVVAGWPDGDDALAERGERLLERYFEWAPAVDLFTPVRVETDFDVTIPDPADPRHDLAASDGSAVHFSERVELVVADPFNAYWLVTHLVGDRWAHPDALALDERGAACSWAWGRCFLGMDVTGVIYNELRTDTDLEADDVAETTFRRTQVHRDIVELERARYTLGTEARAMTAPDVATYPTPSWDVCSSCAYRPPCIALNTGADAALVLAGSYRRRPPVEEPEGRLGGVTWSMGRGAAPPKFGRAPRPDH